MITIRNIKMEIKNYAEDKYWHEFYDKETDHIIIKKNKIVKDWINKYLPKNNLSCFEIGCFPGNYLAIFGDLGYILNGIDIYNEVNSLSATLNALGYKVGGFFCDNFINFSSDIKFDVVCSFGFLEHFENWEYLIIKHCELLKSKGYLVIEVPNYSGLMQRIFRIIKDYNNYKLHNIKSMNPFKWASILKEQGFEIIYCGYFGPVYFQDIKDRSDSKIKAFLFKGLTKLPWNKEVYSPFCGLIARKCK